MYVCNCINSQKYPNTNITQTTEADDTTTNSRIQLYIAYSYRIDTSL